jgi:hypothetical protein
MRRTEVFAAMLVAACLSVGCDRSLADGSVTAPSSISTRDKFPAVTGAPTPPLLPPGPFVPPAAPTLPGPPQSDRCDHTKVRLAIGSPASIDLLERARLAAGARTARFLRPHDIVTLEYLGSRLNLLLDARDIVRSMYCG